MWPQRVEAHAGPMFTSHSNDITRALVAERQASLRNEIHQNRARTRGRRSSRARDLVRPWLADLLKPPPPPTASSVREYLLR